jgi:hypothetical protein
MKILQRNDNQVLLDDDMTDSILDNYHWWIKQGHKTKYVNLQHKKTRKKFFLHRVIMGLEIGNPLCVDHINGNGLDNRKENMRIVTLQNNSLHIVNPMKGEMRGIRPVSNSSKNTWEIRVIRDGKVHCRYASSLKMAKEIARDLRKELYGEFA